MTDDLVKRLSRIGERVAVPCPDNIKGCLVFHFRIETDPVCQEAIDRIEALEKALLEAKDDATRFGRLMEKCVIALREIKANLEGVPDYPHSALEIARAALGEKNEQ